MVMTHYMDLMMGHWYLLVLFMAVPMALAESYVVSEILLLLKGSAAGAGLKRFNKWSIYVSALVITALCLYAGAVFARVDDWRTWVDVVASVSYVACFIPIVLVALIEAGILLKGADAMKKGVAAVAAVVAYLILAHMAMVFGMFDPMQFGYQPKAGEMMHHAMPGMNHGAEGMHCGMEMPPAPGADDGCPHHGAAAQEMVDHTGMKAPEGAPIPPGYHRMADGTLMKNGGMAMPAEGGMHHHHAAP